MANEVATVLHDGGVLLAEAGTGTGKTLAYLVPAILGRKRVLVSTGTKNLQEQIYFKDLPVLRDALGVPFTATYMKGRANYLCLHRFEQRRADGDVNVEGLATWVGRTETGDRAEIEDLPEESALWASVSATAETCLGGECPRYHECFVTRMRQRAAESDLVIVNHHLLCADAAVRESSYGEVIPECHDAIIDEAHQLEDVATQYFGTLVSNYRLEELVRDTGRVVERAVNDEGGRYRREIDRVDERARAFFGAVALARRSRGPVGDERLRIAGAWFGEIAGAGVSLLTALDGLEATLALASSAAGHPGVDAESHEEVAAVAARTGAIRDDLRFLMSAEDAGFVYFVETRGRGVFLRAAPIDVSRIVRERLLSRMHATVLTSATLSVEGSFDYVRQRLGVTRAGEIRVPSEFDYRRQAILYLPRRMPLPKAPHYAEAAAAEVVGIVRRTRGRAFVLFTSHSAMRTVHALAGPAIPYPLLLQGTAPRSALLTEFRVRPNAVLFATSSFWQGVDVVGEQLSCVIIDKLPFASPGDPITAARVEAIVAAGGDAFHEYQVPLAVLTLLQGVGRLLRHRTDRGALAILDPRLKTMAYGRRFLESLPPAPVTHDLAAIERFFAVDVD
ncbi:MAG: ATP-dependent DNA helicase [Acidobacteria bacterium]|nr:ATP-dependent DNA helicase [Acidobacteriota bacterium]